MKHTAGKHAWSLRSGLMTMILICWVLPIVMVVTLAAVLISTNYQKSTQEAMDTDLRYAAQQIFHSVEDAFEASKAVSYDGVVRNAYRSWLEGGDTTALYRETVDNLTQNYARDKYARAVFLNFWEDVNVVPYVTNYQSHGASAISKYRDGAEELVLSEMKQVNTEIRFLACRGELYLCRNLVDAQFRPYATVVMICDTSELFRSLDTVRRLGEVSVGIDGALILTPDGVLEELDTEPEHDRQITTTVDGHSFTLYASVPAYDIWEEMPSLRVAVGAVILLVLPLLLVMLVVFRRQVTRPMEELVDATTKVQDGQRGYVIEEAPGSREFQQLYGHFNAMSTELQSQFERSYREQQALQQARMKALQSQINPHFLNNTLEIINWEARIAGNDRIGEMIEALSTMLDAALDRDGRSRIPLREEMSYVDAYLYITRVRLGDRLRVEKQVEPAALEMMIPRLILQPIVENAVEHDITPNRGGALRIRAFLEKERLVLEVERDGALSSEDQEKLETILRGPVEDVGTTRRVGLSNVRERLWLLYGEAGEISVAAGPENTVVARVSIPVSG